MDGFCLQGELDLTLFYKIEGYWGIFEKPKSLMTENDHDRKWPDPFGGIENDNDP